MTDSLIRIQREKGLEHRVPSAPGDEQRKNNDFAAIEKALVKFGQSFDIVDCKQLHEKLEEMMRVYKGEADREYLTYLYEMTSMVLKRVDNNSL